jgi:hypothetical protein
MRSATVVFVLLPLACSAFTLDASITSQGNKRRVAYSHVTDVKIRDKACAAHIKSWTEWDGGFSARIGVHNKDEAAIEKWSAVIELDRTVYLLDADDAEVNKTGGANFTVKAAPWNSKAEKGEEREFNVYARFSPDSVAPKLKALTINDGQRMECIHKKNEVLLKKGKKAEFLSMPKKVITDSHLIFCRIREYLFRFSACTFSWPTTPRKASRARTTRGLPSCSTGSRLPPTCCSSPSSTQTRWTCPRRSRSWPPLVGPAHPAPFPPPPLFSSPSVIYQ